MENNGILSERAKEFRVQSEKDLNKINDYLKEQYKDTVKNFYWLTKVLSEKEMKDIESLKKKINGVGELKIEIKITHES